MEVEHHRCRLEANGALSMWAASEQPSAAVVALRVLAYRWGAAGVSLTMPS